MSANENSEERKAAVEAVVRAGRWSLNAQQQLSRTFGCTTRTIREDKRRLIEGWRRDISDEHFDSVEFLQRLHGVIEIALKKGQVGPAVRALEIEAQVCGHREGIDGIRRPGGPGVDGAGSVRGPDTASRLRAALGGLGEE